MYRANRPLTAELLGILHAPFECRDGITLAVVGSMITYSLPDGTLVKVHADVYRLASVITYTRKGGRIVDAIIVKGQR